MELGGNLARTTPERGEEGRGPEDVGTLAGRGWPAVSTQHGLIRISPVLARAQGRHRAQAPEVDLHIRLFHTTNANLSVNLVSSAPIVNHCNLYLF